MTLPLAVTNPMRASGGSAPISLLDLRTASGNIYYWSDQQRQNTAAILSSGLQNYQGWIVGAPRFTVYGTTQTDTGSLSIQNLSGNTVTRDVATAFTKAEFAGAFCYYRLLRGDSEAAIFTFMGNVTDVEVDEQQMDLTIEGFNNWSDCEAPAYDVDVNCPLTFASLACGSTSPTPCQNTYGTCSSLNRFAGAILQWDGANNVTQTTQIAQPAPRVLNVRQRPF